MRRKNSILLVRQSAGHSLAGQWTIPWGQLDPGESPTAAVAREVQEEGGVVATVEGLLGVQELPDPWLGMIGIVFLCEHVEGHPRPDQRETDAAEYFDAGQLASLADPVEPLSAWIVGRVFNNDYRLTKTNAASPFATSPGYF